MAASAADQQAFPVGRRPGCRPDGCAGLCTDEGLAFAYRTYRGPLFGRARTITGDAGLAEEAVQETFVRAWRACRSFDPAGGPMASWLSVIVRNVCLDLLRARGRRPRLLASVPDDVAAAGRNDVDAMVLRTDLDAALRRIRAEHRAALVETVLRDRPYEEVAAELGIPIGTLRSRVFYALRKLGSLVDPTDLAA